MNETACNEDHYMPRLMWPHGSSLWRNGGKRSHVVTSHDDVGRVAQSCCHASWWCWSRGAVMSSRLVMMSVASRSHVVTSHDDVGRVAQSRRHVSWRLRSRRCGESPIPSRQSSSIGRSYGLSFTLPLQFLQNTKLTIRTTHSIILLSFTDSNAKTK